MPVAVGSVIGGRYELRSKVGKGGVGEVWEATDRTTRAVVALKLLRSFHRSDANVRARFEREARLLARIDSPRVCSLLDFAVDGEQPYLVFELLRGASLDKVLRAGRSLPLPEVAQIVDDIFAGLVDAHAAGVVHRDLKPANVVVVEGRAKLIDFGISKLLPATKDATLTTAKATLGSPQYMAPEQLVDAHAADERCDIYAAATIAFRALTGRLPFASDNPSMLLALKREYAAETLDEATKRTWPPSLQPFFDITLARLREARPRTAKEARLGWKRACAEAATEHGIPSALPTDPSMEDGETPVLSRRRR
jgi:eukaryotic-like serine/threonine-protein kinase